MYDLSSALIIIASQLLCAYVSMRMITKKNWSPALGFMIGLTFGILGVLLVYTLPIAYDIRKTADPEPVFAGKWVTCVHCQTTFRSDLDACPWCDEPIAHVPLLPS